MPAEAPYLLADFHGNASQEIIRRRVHGASKHHIMPDQYSKLVRNLKNQKSYLYS